MNIERANRLADLRKTNGFSQEELAEKIGVSRQAVSKWENGESSPDTDNLIALASLYGITLDELVNGPKPNEEKVEPEIEVIDSDGDDDESKPRRMSKPQAFINSIGFPIAIVIYLLMGFFWTGPNGGLGWAAGWVVFLLPVVISSFVSAVEERRFSSFQPGLVMLIVIVYCGMGIIGNAYGNNLWHPEWVMFLFIPIYSIASGYLDKRKRAD